MEKNLKVLVVEDEAITAQAIYEDLKDAGASPLKPVPSGELAVQTALNEKPNLILMDIRLAGGLDGIEAAQQILREIKIPIIFMTGFSTDYIREKVSVIDYLAFLEKPVDIHQLEQILKKPSKLNNN